MKTAGSVLQRTIACDRVGQNCNPPILSELRIAPIYRILKKFPKYFGMERHFVFSGGMESPPYHYHLPTGSLQ